MIPVTRDVILKRLRSELDISLDVGPVDLTEPIRRPEIDPGLEVPFVPMPVVPQPYPADEALMPPLDISVPKALPGGLKMWHLLVALGVLFWMKKR